MAWKMALFFFRCSSLWAGINIYCMTSVSAQYRYSGMPDFHFFLDLTSVLKFISFREVQLFPTESPFSSSFQSSFCHRSNVIIQCIKAWLRGPLSFWLADFHFKRKISNAFWFFTPWNFSSPWAMALELPLGISDHSFIHLLSFCLFKRNNPIYKYFYNPCSFISTWIIFIKV